MRFNNNGVPVTIIKSNWLKQLLNKFSTHENTLSFSAKIPEWFFHLPDSKLKAFLKGYYDGDGTKNVGKNQGNKKYVLSTSSYELALDLQRIAMHLGFSFHVWKQENHKGAGKKPIYRLTRNTNSYFLKDYGYDGLSEVSISKIEKLGYVDMYDLTVQDTHTVIMRNGIVTHQCEDTTVLFVTLCRIAGVPSDRVFNATGWFDNKYGHSFPIVKMEDDKWYVMETTLKFIPNKPILFKGSRYSCKFRMGIGGVNNWEHKGVIKNDQGQI